MLLHVEKAKQKCFSVVRWKQYRAIDRTIGQVSANESSPDYRDHSQKQDKKYHRPCYAVEYITPHHTTSHHTTPHHTTPHHTTPHHTTSHHITPHHTTIQYNNTNTNKALTKTWLRMGRENQEELFRQILCPIPIEMWPRAALYH